MLFRSEFKIKAELDQMTGVYNNITAEELIRAKLAKHPNQSHALMIVDIDNFKSVNDIEGHQVGDDTIKAIADILASRLERKSVVEGKKGAGRGGRGGGRRGGGRGWGVAAT